MQCLTLLSILSLIICNSWAFNGPELKTSSPGIYRRSSKLASQDGYKLPGNARPLMYDLTLTFKTNESGYPGDTVDGEVIITLDVDPSKTEDKTKSLQINAAINLDSETPPTFIWNDAMTCTIGEVGAAYITITCPESIEGNSQTLRIKYTTNFATDDEYGMYSLYYSENNVTKYMIATHLEQDYARRIFPCFDEPEYKAPIKLTLKADTATTYDSSNWIANTNVAGEWLDGTIKTTTFETTPNMSAYLLAFVVTSDFKNYSTPDLKTDYTFQIFAKPSAENFVSIALDNGPKLIDLMGDFTGITFTSLGHNKMVLAAIPEMNAGTMKNWGLITFREYYLIDEGDATTAKAKQSILQVIAQELAHQWFGHYDILDWSSEAWIYEGFAQYFQFYLPDQISTEFDTPKQFVVVDKQRALKTDGFADTVPLSKNASEVISDTNFPTEFGDISSVKGASIIKILHQALGDAAFQSGLYSYLHNYVPTAKHLLYTLQTAVPEGQDLDLAKLFKEWIYEKGYPLLDVSLNDENEVTIQATKFSSSSDKTKENNTAIWWIPLTYTISEKTDFDTISFDWIYSADLPSFTATLPDKNDSWIIFNLQSIGFYRVNYDQKLWDRIITVLNNSTTYTTIDVLNRAQLIDDIFNIAKSYQTEEKEGTLYYLTAFKLVEYLQYETEYYPWYTFFTEMQYLMEIIQDELTLSALKERILSLISPQLVIPKDTDQPTHTEILKINLLLNWACKLGHEECTQWAHEEFEIYRNSSKGNNNYRDLVMCTRLALTINPYTDFGRVLNMVTYSDLPNQQLDLIEALPCTSREYLIQFLLDRTVLNLPYERRVPRMYYGKLITTLMSGGFEKLRWALDFVLIYDSEIIKHWLQIDTPEILMKKIASKIYNQELVDMLNKYITNKEPRAEYASRVKAAKEAVEIANENIEYLKQYSDILQHVIVYNGEPTTPTTTTTTTTPTTTTTVTTTTTTTTTTTEAPTTPGSANQINFNILLSSALAFLLKSMLC